MLDPKIATPDEGDVNQTFEGVKVTEFKQQKKDKIQVL